VGCGKPETFTPCCWDTTKPLEEKLPFKDPIVEVGFGNGDFTVELAKRFPESPVLGVDRWHPGVRALVHKCQNEGLKNLFVFNLDANLFVQYLLKPAQAAAFYFNYPDPYFKKKDIEKGRRLLRAPFLKWLALKLKDGGKVYFRTDVKDYFDYVLEEVKKVGDLFEVKFEFDWDLPPTKYERKALKEGRRPHKLLLIKRASPPLEDKEVEPLRAVKISSYDLSVLRPGLELKDPKRGYFMKVERTYRGEGVDLVETFVGEEGFYQHLFVGIFRTKDGFVVKPKSFAVGVRSVSWMVENLARLLEGKGEGQTEEGSSTSTQTPLR